MTLDTLDFEDQLVTFRSPSSGRHRVGRVIRDRVDAHGRTISISAGGDLYHLCETDVLSEVNR